ncbi:hypothetical protein [Streptomyces sp. NPDC001480]|uniref:hypothetical protein n=1 Tax=Streptomyces sp. NPDC001480 TaxID=3364577 RepID=UPI003697B335
MAEKRKEIAAEREDYMAKREWVSTAPHAGLPAARIRAALDEGHGIAVLALKELVDPADAARLIGGDRADVHLVHLHVARTVSRCGADWLPSSLPDDPDADLMLYRRSDLGELGELLDALRQLTGPFAGAAAHSAAVAARILSSSPGAD